jgi:purine-binding chemotaxis protein CheW
MSENIKVSDNQYVLFKLADEIYGLDILQVETIEKIMDITRIPNAASYVEGVINLRKRFSFSEIDNNDDTRIIIVNVDDVLVGLLVDSSSEVVQLSSDEIEEFPELSNNFENQFVLSIGKKENRIIMLLDSRKVLGFTENNDNI